jgi:hypothetical protein
VDNDWIDRQLHNPVWWPDRDVRAAIRILRVSNVDCGATDTAGRFLDGSVQGNPGTNYDTTLTRNNLVIPASMSARMKPDSRHVVTRRTVPAWAAAFPHRGRASH